MLRVKWRTAAVLGAAAVAVALTLPTFASAYPAPSGVGSNTSVCPPRPADDSGSQSGVDTTTLAQELADACQLAVQDQSQLDGDLKQVDSDETAGTTKLDADLGQLDHDVQQLDSDVKSQGSADAPASTVAVSNFPSDQQVSLDSASEAQQDSDDHGVYSGMWVIAGAVVGCFALGQVLDRLWL